MLAILAAALPATQAFITHMEVTPPAPGCDDAITFSIEGYFPDLCWQVEEIEYLVVDNVHWFVVHAVDHWFPGAGCLLAIVEYSAEQTIEPLPGRLGISLSVTT